MEGGSAAALAVEVLRCVGCGDAAARWWRCCGAHLVELRVEQDRTRIEVDVDAVCYVPREPHDEHWRQAARAVVAHPDEATLAHHRHAFAHVHL